MREIDRSVSVRRWLVAGRVQGVGFRWFVQRAAQELGVDGTVRNLPDGRVEAIARGAAATLDELEATIRRGPASSRVEHVHAETLDAGQRLRPGFHVIR